MIKRRRVFYEDEITDCCGRLYLLKKQKVLFVELYYICRKNRYAYYLRSICIVIFSFLRPL